MRTFRWLLLGAAFPVAALAAAQAPGPDWAFMRPDPNAPAAAASTAAAPVAQPGAPAMVTRGKGATAPACATCHTPSGMGMPQTANVRGVNADYFIRQMMDFKSGARGGPRANHMQIAAALSDAEIAEIAKYYAGLSPVRWVRIVESATVPKTIVGRDSQRTKLAGTETEPLGKRIIEFPENPAALNQVAMPAFTAYIPMGSLFAGKALVEGSKTEECASCHGDGLKGSEDIPRIAGRSPVYIARQLYSFKNGVRKGDYADVMKSIADSLTDDDIIAAASYVASLNPS